MALGENNPKKRRLTKGKGGVLGPPLNQPLKGANKVPELGDKPIARAPRKTTPKFVEAPKLKPIERYTPGQVKALHPKNEKVILSGLENLTASEKIKLGIDAPVKKPARKAEPKGLTSRSNRPEDIAKRKAEILKRKGVKDIQYIQVPKQPKNISQHIKGFVIPKLPKRVADSVPYLGEAYLVVTSGVEGVQDVLKTVDGEKTIGSLISDQLPLGFVIDKAAASAYARRRKKKGKCPKDSDRDSIGRRCGGRSAQSRGPTTGYDGRVSLGDRIATRKVKPSNEGTLRQLERDVKEAISLGLNPLDLPGYEDVSDDDFLRIVESSK